MNWRKGLFRLWVFASVCWIVFWVWRLELLNPILGCNLAVNMFCDLPLALGAYFRTGLFLILPPLGALAALYAVRWAISGFRQL